VNLEDRHSAEMSPFLVSYSKHLDAELKKSVNTGDITKYEKLEQEKKRFESEKTIPADSMFRKSVAELEIKKIAMLNEFSIKYVTALKTHQISLMKAQNMDGAKEVQQEIDKILILIEGYASQLPAATAKKVIGGGSSVSKMSLTKPAAIKVNWKSAELLAGNSAYDNNAYLVTETPKQLEGYFFTQLTKRKEAAIQFEVTDGGIVYSFGYSAPDDKWKETGWDVGVNLNGNIVKFEVYKKVLIEGNYTLPAGRWLIFPK